MTTEHNTQEQGIELYSCQNDIKAVIDLADRMKRMQLFLQERSKELQRASKEYGELQREMVENKLKKIKDSAGKTVSRKKVGVKQAMLADAINHNDLMIQKYGESEARYNDMRVVLERELGFLRRQIVPSDERDRQLKEYGDEINRLRGEIFHCFDEIDKADGRVIDIEDTLGIRQGVLGRSVVNVEVEELSAMLDKDRITAAMLISLIREGLTAISAIVRRALALARTKDYAELYGQHNRKLVDGILKDIGKAKGVNQSIAEQLKAQLALDKKENELRVVLVQSLREDGAKSREVMKILKGVVPERLRSPYTAFLTNLDGREIQLLTDHFAPVVTKLHHFYGEIEKRIDAQNARIDVVHKAVSVIEDGAKKGGTLPKNIGAVLVQLRERGKELAILEKDIIGFKNHVVALEGEIDRAYSDIQSLQEQVGRWDESLLKTWKDMREGKKETGIKGWFQKLKGKKQEKRPENIDKKPEHNPDLRLHGKPRHDSDLELDEKPEDRLTA
jgi:ribosome-binding protein aMBF1 (putative translation factor)